ETPFHNASVNVPRLSSGGTPIVAGEVALSGWGAGASVAVGGTHRVPIFIVTSGTGPSANPTITLTFHDGGYTAAPTWLAVMTGGAGALVFIHVSARAGCVTFTYGGTPEASRTFQIEAIGVGY